MSAEVIHGDCLDVMPTMDTESVDAIVCDPPYGLSFMGKAWDHGVPGIPFWTEALRVAKPGAHLLAFGGTRTYHRLTCAIEDAGWEIRDCLSWLYGSGFPKSLDVGKAIDKAAGAEREVIGSKDVTRDFRDVGGKSLAAHGIDKIAPGTESQGATVDLTAPATDAARQWDGWGTALKPAWEPIILARKPLIGTVAANVTQHGTGALNISGCRVGTGGQMTADHVAGNRSRENYRTGVPVNTRPADFGRWPANVVLDEEAAGMLDEQSGTQRSGVAVQRNGGGQRIGSGRCYSGTDADLVRPDIGYGDSGGASRFYYTAKASRGEREAGLGGLHGESLNGKQVSRARNHHPTVKPLSLMRWLCKMVTPPSGLILDPFCGSGSTGCAAALEGFRFVGIEREAEYVEIARARIRHWAGQRELTLFNEPAA